MPVTSDRPSRAEKLFQVDLQSDNEEEENQADLRNQLDGLFILDPGETDLRANDDARDQVGKNQRLFQKFCDEREDSRDRKDKTNIGEKTVLLHIGTIVSKTAEGKRVRLFAGGTFSISVAHERRQAIIDFVARQRFLEHLIAHVNSLEAHFMHGLFHSCQVLLVPDRPCRFPRGLLIVVLLVLIDDFHRSRRSFFRAGRLLAFFLRETSERRRLQ